VNGPAADLTGVDELRVAEETLTRAIELDTFGTFLLDVRSGALTLSRGTEQKLGYAPGSLPDIDTLGRFVHPDDLPGARRIHADAIERRLPRYDFVYRLRDGAGEYRVLKGTLHCIYDRAGELVRVVGSTEELSGSRGSELAGGDAQLRSVIDAVPDPMLVVDQHGLIRSFNRGAEQVFGYRGNDAIGRSFAILAPREVTGTSEHAFTRVLRASKPGMPSPPLHTRARRSDGKEFSIEMRIQDISSGDEPLFAIVMRDITDRLDAEERLRTLSDELAHSMRVNAMGEMAADIAHELNQPLAALSNYTEAAKLLLAQSDSTDPRVLDMLESAARQAVRAGTIIRRIRKFVTRGEVEVRIEPVEETVRDAVNLVFVGRTQFAIRVSLAFDRLANHMLADRVQVQQVIVNLLRNSIDALQSVDPENRNILVKVQKSGNMIQISVSDTGPGIPASVLDQLYEPFRSTKGRGGMGVGLTISRRIVEAHGGRIWAENRPEGGACFQFTIPAIDSAEEEEPEA
jgi:two-component system, LuxR family, sensor kinase FixL